MPTITTQLCLQLAIMNLEKYKLETTKSIAKEAETKTTSERASAVLEKANRDYLQCCLEAEQASKEMVENMVAQETIQKEVDQLLREETIQKEVDQLLREETIQKEVDQLLREQRIQEIQDKIRIQNEVSAKQAQASALRQAELEAELAFAAVGVGCPYRKRRGSATFPN